MSSGSNGFSMEGDGAALGGQAGCRASVGGGTAFLHREARKSV